MHSSDQVQSIGRRRRRRHSAAFKAEAVAACQHPGVSIASVALARSLNANLLRRWVVEAERAGAVPVERLCAPTSATENSAGFLPVSVSPASSSIRIEVRRGSSTVSVEWPVTAARECALALRELLK